MKVRISLDAKSHELMAFSPWLTFSLRDQIMERPLTPAQQDRYILAMRKLCETRLKELKNRIELDHLFVIDVLIRESCTSKYQ